MKLIVGLGNPGKEYDGTRHNIGFMFLDKIVDKEFRLNNKFNALECEDTIDGEKIIYIKPLSYMNLSGGVVRKYTDYYKIDSKDVLVIQDDLDMPVGKLKILYNHGDGGHNGIKDIVRCLNTKEFYRVKIGISKNDLVDTKDYVLGRFNNQEMELIDSTFNNIKNIINDFVSMDSSSFIQKYNTKN